MPTSRGGIRGPTVDLSLPWIRETRTSVRRQRKYRHSVKRSDHTSAALG